LKHRSACEMHAWNAEMHEIPVTWQIWRSHISFDPS